MYRKIAVKFHKKQVEFINCVNMVERVKRARSMHAGDHMGEKKYVVSSTGIGKKTYLSIKDCS